MKQTSESAVRPRRHVLTALWASIIGLWGATTACTGRSGRPASESEITMLVGRLCIDRDFRTAYFAASSDEAAISDAKSKGMALDRDATKEAVGKMRAAHKSPNRIEDACAAVGEQLRSAGIQPCNPWPC